MVTIVYSKTFNDYTHEGNLIYDLEVFIGNSLKAGLSIQFVTVEL